MAIPVKRYAKADISVSTPVQFCLISLLCFKYFIQDCRFERFFGSFYLKKVCSIIVIRNGKISFRFLWLWKYLVVILWKCLFCLVFNTILPVLVTYGYHEKYDSGFFAFLHKLEFENANHWKKFLWCCIHLCSLFMLLYSQYCHVDPGLSMLLLLKPYFCIINCFSIL